MTQTTKKQPEPELEYVQCPHCAMRYKHNTKVYRDAIEGHIELKHKDKPLQTPTMQEKQPKQKQKQ